MSLDADWRADIDAVDAALIDEYQSGFPVESRPFERVARDITAETGVDIDADAVLDRVRDLRERGVFRRFGAVLNPPVIGSSTLAAVRAPEDRFNEVAEVINGYQQVNHNYRRDHEWNQWFVVTAGSRETRDAILAEIEERTGCEVLALPMLTDYYIDLEFPVVNGDRFARESGEARSASDSASGGERSDPRASDHTDVSATRISETPAAISRPSKAISSWIQDGFPCLRPPPDVASEIDAPHRGRARSGRATRGRLHQADRLASSSTTSSPGSRTTAWWSGTYPTTSSTSAARRSGASRTSRCVTTGRVARSRSGSTTCSP